MTLEIMLFGPPATHTGKRSVRIDLADEPGPPSAQRVLEALGEAEPELRSVLDRARLAVNHRFATPEQPVSESDELALIALVSGG